MLPPAANDNEPVDPARSISARLRRREPVSDEVFDSLLGERPRKKSRHCWSNVEAAQTAARLLREAGATRVLDVGSGAGKFTAIAALDLDRRVWGVERRAELVLEARRLAATLGADVEITQSTLDAFDVTRFDGFYFFNPFGEYVADEEDRYDDGAPRSFEPYLRDARLVERWLRAAPQGTAMVTYNGLGGRIPVSFRVKTTLHVRDDTMRLWVKERPQVSREAYIEIEEQLITATELAELAGSDNQLLRELSRASD